jgi:hypothetical protein
LREFETFEAQFWLCRCLVPVLPFAPEEIPVLPDLHKAWMRGSFPCRCGLRAGCVAEVWEAFSRRVIDEPARRRLS